MKTILTLALAGCLTALQAQQFEIRLDDLAAKASNKVDISLDGSLLQFAAKFLDANDPDDAKVKKLLEGIQGIYVKSYTFKDANVWTPADLDGIRKQLHGPEWSRMVRASDQDGENEVWLRTAGKKISGVAILSAEPKELTVVNIVGTVDLDSLAALGGHFGIPKNINPAPKHE